MIATLEQSLSQGRDGASRLAALKPDLDVLIKMSEEMAAAMESQVDVCNKERSKALVTIGECNVKKQALEERVVTSKADIARGASAAAEKKEQMEVLYREMAENENKIAELERKEALDAKYAKFAGFSPGLGIFLQVKALVDNFQKRKAILEQKLDEAGDELKSTFERYRSMDDDLHKLLNEKAAMERQIYELNQSNNKLDRRSRAYARRLADFHEAKMFYRLLSNEIENLQGSLGLPRLVKRLLESVELVQITGDRAGQQERSTLKELLIHLGGEYDRYKEHGLPEITDGVTGVYYKVDPIDVNLFSGGFSKCLPWPPSKL